jgi:hypothetical protein
MLRPAVVGRSKAPPKTAFTKLELHLLDTLIADKAVDGQHKRSL